MVSSVQKQRYFLKNTPFLCNGIRKIPCLTCLLIFTEVFTWFTILTEVSFKSHLRPDHMSCITSYYTSELQRTMVIHRYQEIPADFTKVNLHRLSITLEDLHEVFVSNGWKLCDTLYLYITSVTKDNTWFCLTICSHKTWKWDHWCSHTL